LLLSLPCKTPEFYLSGFTPDVKALPITAMIFKRGSPHGDFSAARIRSGGTSGNQENGQSEDKPENSFHPGENSNGSASFPQFSRLRALPVSSEIHFAGV
jgi:hypothetical protein